MSQAAAIDTAAVKSRGAFDRSSLQSLVKVCCRPQHHPPAAPLNIIAAIILSEGALGWYYTLGQGMWKAGKADKQYKQDKADGERTA